MHMFAYVQSISSVLKSCASSDLTAFIQLTLIFSKISRYYAATNFVTNQQ